MKFMEYPTFEFIEERGQYIPCIHLPKNFKELVPKFYEQERKKDVEDYAGIVKEKFLKGELEIRLRWNDERGLTNISVGPSGGLDLDTQMWPNFREHNIGTKTGIAAGFIAMKYISELLKSQ